MDPVALSPLRVARLRFGLTRYAWERNARSNGQRMLLEGYVGEMGFRGDLQPFLPLLTLGEHLHVGSYTAFGHGKYVLRRHRDE